MESDILIRGSTVSRCGPAPCPRPICSLGPLEANHSPVSRAPQPNGLDAVCAALLIIQFVAKQLPIWHIWCSSHLVCLNWTMRKRRMRSGRRSGFILRDAVIFSHLLYRLLFQCRGEIVLTAYKKEKRKHSLTGGWLFLASFVFGDNLYYPPLGLFSNAASPLHYRHLLQGMCNSGLHMLGHVFDRDAAGGRRWSLRAVNKC